MISAPVSVRRRFSVGRVLLWLLALLAVAVAALVGVNNWRAARVDRPLNAPALTETELQSAAAIFRIKSEVGDRLWPGFGAAPIPIVLFNDSYEFLLGAGTAPAGWTEVPVPGGSDPGRPYYSRPAQNPQAFAVRVGDGWAGSMTIPERTDRDLFLIARREMPAGLGHLLPYSLIQIPPDVYPALVLHETFHAYQATQAPQRFARWKEFYRGKASYPYDNEAFRESWNQEGRLLARALKEPDDARAAALAREFLDVRTERRRLAQAGPALLSFERDVEWLEGLAKYAEIRSYEVESGADGLSDLKFWQNDLRNLETGLGRQESDLRFYLSGMAMARLLDRFDTEWKGKALAEGVYLEDLLQGALTGR